MTLSVRSFHVPATPGTCAWPPSLPSVPTSRATRRHFAGKGVELIHHRVDRVLQLQNFAFHVDRDLAIEIAAGHGGGDFRDIADLRGEVGAHSVDRVGEILPRPRHAGHHGLHAEPAFGADFAGHARHFRGEGAKLFDHRIDRFLQLQNLAAHVDGDLPGKVAVGDGDGHLGDVAHLAGQVGGHRVHVVGEILPRPRHPGHLRLAAELALGADLARHACDFRGEGRELLDHRVDGVLQLQNFALHVDGDLAGKVAVGDGSGHVGDVAHLPGQVGGHRVDVVGEILPRPRHAGHHRLAAELAVGADLARHTAHFAGKGAELIDHRVDGFLQLQNFAAHVDGDLLGQIAIRHRDRHLGDVAHLPGQVVGHGVDVVGEILPRPRHPGHLRLTAELAVGADLARHAAHFAGKGVELVHHRVDRVLQLQNFAFHLDRDLAIEIAAGHGGGDFRDVADLRGEVGAHEVDVVGEILPRPRHAGHLRLATELALGADFAGHARHFRGEGSRS